MGTQKNVQHGGTNAIPCRGYNPSVAPLKAKRRASSPYTGEPRFALRCRRRHCAAVTPAAGGRPSSVTVRAAPHRATFPEGKAMCSAQSTGEPRTLIAPCSKQKLVLKAKAPCSFEHGAFLYNSFYQLSRSFLQRI